MLKENNESWWARNILMASTRAILSLFLKLFQTQWWISSVPVFSCNLERSERSPLFMFFPCNSEGFSPRNLLCLCFWVELEEGLSTSSIDWDCRKNRLSEWNVKNIFIFDISDETYLLLLMKKQRKILKNRLQFYKKVLKHFRIMKGLLNLE